MYFLISAIGIQWLSVAIFLQVTILHQGLFSQATTMKLSVFLSAQSLDLLSVVLKVRRYFFHFGSFKTVPSP